MTDTVFGRKIHGEVNIPYNASVEQESPERFVDALNKLLGISYVESVKWAQYTPYFNDGDPCVFTASFRGVKLVGGDEEAGDYEDGYIDRYELSNWDHETKKSIPLTEKNGYDITGLVDIMNEFEKVIEKGHQFIMLQKTFGDPSEIVATDTGFHIEYYDHD